MPKNCVYLTIRDCQYCPCATLKYDQGSEEDIMYCQTNCSLIMLREQWGSRDIPNWCPFLREQVREQAKARKRQHALRLKRMSDTHIAPKEELNEE